ncbi:GntR family transcriptional regulator [Geodermatophilus sabuli]|uniref:GntR family transcriptional regulator n=1 Tax=Geodermatophilus sabuli TaxID=1564158 RepID=A0A7K3VWH0_9ACTN|nr:GntR family transcriptional regulator [Geodermatophilus sabuli]NEK56995.1 GntR family transcriptional regulator [Geodermatophilus sabuli]
MSPDPTAAGALAGFSPIQRGTIRDATRDALRDLIISGGVEVDTPLRQDELAARLGISRTPLREALHALASEGLVTFDAHRGAVVTRPSVAQLLDLYEIREQLEVLAGRKVVAGTTDAHIRAVHDLHDSMQGVTDPVAWAQLNQQFHATLYAPCENRELIALISTLSARAKFYVRILVSTGPSAAVAHGEHGEMLAALTRRDPDAMEAAIRSHLQGTAAHVAPALAADGG